MTGTKNETESSSKGISEKRPTAVLSKGLLLSKIKMGTQNTDHKLGFYI